MNFHVIIFIVAGQVTSIWKCCMHAVLHSVCPVECCHGYLVCANNARGSRRSHRFCGQGAILPGVGPWRSAFPAHILCHNVQQHDVTSITQPNMHWMRHHARHHVRIAFPAAKNDQQAKEFARQAWIPRCTPCATYLQFTTWCLRAGLDAYVSGHHSRSARPVTTLCISVHLYGLVSKSLMLPPSAWLNYIDVP